MSYSIEYNRVFLKSAHGYTPVVLMGENNVWEGNRRPRSWGCWCNMLGATSEELYAKAASMMGGSNEHWRKNGRFLSDKDLDNWIYSGIAKAVSLESVLAVNRLRAVSCMVYIYPKGSYAGKRDLEFYCSTTEELDEWIEQVRECQKNPNYSYSPVISFSTEDIHLPPMIKGPVLLKRGRTQYVQKLDYANDGHVRGVSYTSDVRNAMVFESCEKIPNLIFFGKTRAVKADIKNKPNNVVLEITSGVHAGRFIGKRGNRRIMIGPESYARRYPDVKAAMKAKKEIELKYQIECDLHIL